ncbi:MAG: lytic murein transglycosylase [Pseudomonadota bacterium]
MNRRSFLSAMAAVTLAACDGQAQTVDGTTGLPPDLRPTPNANFNAWVARFRSRALRQGISASTYDAAFANAGFLPGVVTRDRTQIQTRRTFEEYLSIATSDERVEKGRAAYARYRSTFDAITARFGVEGPIIAAIWGLESQYGEKRGKVPVISSTATLAFDGRRADLYESQLIAALRILERGDTTPASLTGSWAAAMGHTQFIPTSYEAFAVDFTGDGRRDVWGDDPTDALASAASYLQRNGWQTGVPWGAEAGSGAPSGQTIRPQSGGPAFVVTGNFRVLKRYNNADSYALSIGHLADRIAGAGPLRGEFPPDANGLTKADRIAIQRGLTDRGYDVGTKDGVIGPATEAAIRDFQARNGLSVTGVADRALRDLL